MNKPKYIAIAAMTIDGKIAKTANHFSNWTSKEDKIFMRALLAKCDVVVVGNNTYKTAIKPLSKRNCIVLSKSVHLQSNKLENLVYIDPSKKNIKKYIESRAYRRVALLGGAQAYTYFLEHNLLDEIYLTIEPIVFGNGIDFFSSAKFINKKFKLKKVIKLNSKGSILLHYVKV